MSFHVLVTADWHLGGMGNVLGSGAVDRQITELEAIYRYAVDKSIGWVMVLGDMFDTPTPCYTSIVKLASLLLRYKSVVKTVYLAGNHDYSDRNLTSLDALSLFSQHGLLPGVILVRDKPCLMVFDALTEHMDVVDDITPTGQKLLIDDPEKILVAFLPHPHTTTVSPALGEFFKPHGLCRKKGTLNMVHLDHDEAVNDSGTKLSEFKSIEVYKQNPLDYTISGHIHKHQVIEGRSFMYCGSPYQKSFDEKPPKGFLEIKVRYDPRNRIVVSKKQVPLTTSWQLKNVELKTDDTAALNQLALTLGSKPSTLFRLICAVDVKLPSDFLARHPNVIKVLKPKKKDATFTKFVSALQPETNQAVSVSQADNTEPTERPLDISVTDPCFGLGDFLKARGHGKKEIIEAHRLVKQALDSL